MTRSILFRRTGLVAAAALSAMVLAACGQAPDLRGNDPDKKLLSQIKPGVTDKASVTSLLGSPSSVASFDNDTWYYVSQITKNVAFLKPELLDQKVLAISFDDKGKVKQIARLDLKDHEDVEPNPNATPAPGREFTLLEQLIGNFGRFTSSENPVSEGGSTSLPGPGH
jgi:outer membrane protein assembly factor BamE (lipoprotein component of BamABCDE complex)